MKRILILILLTIPLFNLAQIHKKFFNKKGKEIKDSTKAYNSLVMQKTSDSVWSVVKFDDNKYPLYKGFFLDEELTTPTGKIIFYRPVLKETKINEHHSTIDTIIQVWKTGYYLNGSKEGIWVEYWINGLKKLVSNYENNLLNGLYEEYDDRERIYARSTYVKGVREGDSYIYRADSSVMLYNKFWHGNSIETKEYKDQEIFYNAYPEYNFEYYVKHHLKKTTLPPSHGSVLYTFTVSAEGKLINPKLLIGVNQILDEAIMEVIKSSPTWVAARLNGKRVEQNLAYAFKYDTE